jgi:hypothetical protein
MPSVGVAAGAEHRADAGCGLRRRRAKSGLTLVRLSPYGGSDAIDGSAQGEVEYELTRAQWETRAGSDTCPAD